MCTDAVELKSIDSLSQSLKLVFGVHNKRSKMSSSLGTNMEVDQGLLRRDISYQESQKIYNQWAKEGTYDQMLGRNPKDDYNGLEWFADGMKDLFKDVTKVKVLDLGAGTGLSGEKLRNLGYVNVDGLEPSESMVRVIRKKGLYKRIFETPIISPQEPLDVPDNTYDVVCTVGCFGPGHIPCSAISEMIRITKPGGFILNCMREEFIYTVPEYIDRLIPTFDELQRKGQLQKLEWTKYPNHFTGMDGVRMLYKVLV